MKTQHSQKLISEIIKKNKKEKRERLALIIERLKQIYPTAECALEYGGYAWKLLVMGRLSAQCTDARVNLVTPELFEKYKNVYDIIFDKGEILMKKKIIAI